ncbi:MAG: copper resistance protein CopC, partial [Jatrophihabitans sp.]
MDARRPARGVRPRRHAARRALGLLALLVALFGAGLAFAAAAQAHATVVSSDPADGARLKSVPAQVQVTFDEPVTLGGLGYLHVTDGAGRRVEAGEAFHPAGNRAVVAVRLRAGLGDGTYIESFRVVSADSHPVTGIVRFVVGNGALVLPSSAPASATDPVTSTAFDALRWLSYAGVALLAALWLPLTVWPGGAAVPRVRRTVWWGWSLAVLGTVLEVVVQGPYAAGRGLASVADASLLDGTLHTAYGQASSARLVLLGVAAPLTGLVLSGRRGPYRFAVLPVLAGIALTFSFVGHANTTDPRWLSLTLDAAHLSAMAVWIGGLVLVLVALFPHGAAADLPRVLP